MDTQPSPARPAPKRRRPAGRAGALCLALLMASCAGSGRRPDVTDAGPARPLPPLAAGADPLTRAVRDLASPDFEVRTRAARTLVAAGDRSLPALGRAGELPVPVAGGLEVSATRSVVEAVLAEGPVERAEEHLGSPWSNVRRAAAEELGRRGHWDAIPRLIERLDDPDADVRAASAESLRRLTNQFLGYRATASLGRRRDAADRWRAWWSREGRLARTNEPSARRPRGS
jgi:hypothetical protein